VAEEVGLRAPSLSQRFGSKHDLLLAISARGVERVPELFALARRPQRSGAAAVVAGLRALVRGIDSPATMGHHLAFLAMDLGDPELRRLAGSHAAVLTREIETGLASAVAAGELRGAPSKLARTVYTTYNGSLITWAVGGRGALGKWIKSEVGAVLAPYQKGAGARA
jgi:AcrR family transcriptional regulator